MSNLLWQKPGVTVNENIQRFLAGNDIVDDQSLFLFDIQASQAHAEGLQNIGIRPPPNAGYVRVTDTTR